MRVIFGKPGSKSLLTDRRRPKIVKNDVSRETILRDVKREKWDGESDISRNEKMKDDLKNGKKRV